MKDDDYVFGRPPKYRKAFCKLLIEHMGKGMSYESFGATLDPPCGRSVVYHWEKRHPEFKAAKEAGLAKSEEYFDKVGLLGMTGKLRGFNAAIWVFTRKNKHGWRDQVDLVEQDKDTTKLEDFEFIEKKKDKP